MPNIHSIIRATVKIVINNEDHNINLGEGLGLIKEGVMIVISISNNKKRAATRKN